jgi:hypothetical protein
MKKKCEPDCQEGESFIRSQSEAGKRNAPASAKAAGAFGVDEVPRSALKPS